MRERGLAGQGFYAEVLTRLAQEKEKNEGSNPTKMGRVPNLSLPQMKSARPVSPR
jgi:hypothetical protein